MNTRNENTHCPLTEGLWQNTVACVEEVNNTFGECLNRDDALLLCCIASCISEGTAPLSFCATWLICCGLPPITAAVITPVTGLIDCCIFSTKKIKNKIEKCHEGPQREIMEDSYQASDQIRLSSR